MLDLGGLTLAALIFLLKTFMKNFLILTHHKRLSKLFPIHLNTYVMGPRPLEIF